MREKALPLTHTLCLKKGGDPLKRERAPKKTPGKENPSPSLSPGFSPPKKFFL